MSKATPLLALCLDTNLLKYTFFKNVHTLKNHGSQGPLPLGHLSIIDIYLPSLWFSLVLGFHFSFFKFYYGKIHIP